jgi:hypothetical protein
MLAIPEAQLTTWSNQGSVKESAETNGIIKRALEAPGTPYANKRYESFLQGSYANRTNIWADSDVDIVMKLTEPFYRDLSYLDLQQRAAYTSAHSDADYNFHTFKRDVLAVLQKAFPDDVVPGRKAITIKARGNRRSADVLVCVAYRRYLRFNNVNDQLFDEGICFFLPDGTQIVNYPKQHLANCSSKNADAREWFKPYVRVMKNMRNRLIDKGVIEKRLAPSYFIEGLLYNLLNENFGMNYGNTFMNFLGWAASADASRMRCANQITPLFLEGSPTAWTIGACQTFMAAIRKQWDEWR